MKTATRCRVKTMSAVERSEGMGRALTRYRMPAANRWCRTASSGLVSRDRLPRITLAERGLLAQEPLFTGQRYLGRERADRVAELGLAPTTQMPGRRMSEDQLLDRAWCRGCVESTRRVAGVVTHQPWTR